MSEGDKVYQSSESDVNTDIVNDKLDKITEVLNSFDNRLKIVESTVNSLQAEEKEIESRPRPRPQHTASAANNNSQPHYSDSPTANRACAADTQKEFEAVRDSVSRIVLPPWLKVNDSPAGVKQEHKHVLKILSKSARFTETGLKLLTTFERSDNGNYILTEDEVNALYVTLSASSNFLQGEYTNIVVKSSFNEETSRLFNNLENNTAAFNESSLQNIRIAAELASVSGRSNQRRPARNTLFREQGFRFSNPTNWRGRFSRPTFPRQPYGNYNNNQSFSSRDP